MLSLMAGLWVMSGSAPLAAQTGASAVRSFSDTTVTPGGTLTVSIAPSGYGGFGSVTETLPAGFTYVSQSGADGASANGQNVSFTLIGSDKSFSYVVTASSVEGDYEFSGTLRDDERGSHTVGGATGVKVSTYTPPSGPSTGAGLQFDVVPSKAVKGAVVSGFGHPIESKPLQWEVDETGYTYTDIEGNGVVGDFQIKRVSAGKFGLEVMTSGAPNLSGSQTIDVDVTYTDADGVEAISTLEGTITERAALSFTGKPFAFTIPQDISSGTPVGAFGVSGGITDEYLDGIVNGNGNSSFAVRDSDMTLVYNGGGLTVGTYTFSLTVSGDAGLANRTIIDTVTVTVTSSNMAPSAPATFMATIKENQTGAGLVSAGTSVGDASAGVSANDSDTLAYSLMGADASMFSIDSASGMISVGADGIGDSADGGDVTYTFQVMVSDGITANNQYISATVVVDANASTALAGDALAGNGVVTISRSVPEKDVPLVLVALASLVDDADGDTLTYTVTGNPSHVVYEDSTDELLLTYLPPSADPGPSTSTITVAVSDGFNDPTTADQTVTINLSVTELQPPPVTSKFVGVTVAENSTDCTGCSLAGVVDGAVSYSIESGVDGGDTDYAVSSDGMVSVVNAPDYEDGLNPAFLVNADNADGELAGLISVRVTVTDVDEDPMLDAMSGTAWVYETAQMGDAVMTGSGDDAAAVSVSASDPEGRAITYGMSGKAPFAVNSSTGAITVSGALDTEKATSHTFTVSAMDPAGNSDSMSITVNVLNANETPNFTSPEGDAAKTTIAEDSSYSDGAIFTFSASDEDGDDLTFELREGVSRDLFEIANASKNGAGSFSGELRVKQGVSLDYDNPDNYSVETGHRVHVEVQDPAGLNDTLLLEVKLSNVNDHDPVIGNDDGTQDVAENSPRGTSLGDYGATDMDNTNSPGFDAISYSLAGTHAKYFQISGAGELMTLASLDYDRPVPCGTCSVTVVATDAGGNSDSQDVTITVTAVEDSVSTVKVTKANPVPGTAQGSADTALSGTKTTMSAAVPERPADLPATTEPAPNPMNYVESDWANWGTVLRIEITAESPDASCGNGNQCVVVNVNSDSADDSLKLQAYRSASKENLFVAAVKLVELTSDATPGDAAVYKHNGGGVPALKVDEEDEVEIEFGNLRDTIDVENEAPEVSSFTPEHERAFDDADVDYTFTVTDDISGLPEPEDLPDNDGDGNYTPVVALISKGEVTSDGLIGQCSVSDKGAPTQHGKILKTAAHIHEDDTLYCPGNPQDGEYIASAGGFGFAPIRDDKDFDEIDNGYDVETTIVLTENHTYYVTFIVCDRAGNCAYYDPDGNDDAEELAEITVDTVDPVFVEARTGLTWDSTDNEYDDNRSFVQVIFNDLTTLNPATVEVDDFVVEGHTIKAVHVFENPDDDDVDWGDSGRYAAEGSRNLRGMDRYRDLENVVFIELEDELLADETPDVTIVPNGVEDGAGNEQDDGDHEADDWISPKFTIVSITSTLETSQDQVLAGDGDEVTVVVTADERLDQTRPTVSVTYVNADSVDTKGTASCKNADGSNGTRDRGEIVNNDNCMDKNAAKGGTLNNSVEKVSNTEWIVTVTEPKDTGYYSFRISGIDRSPQENPGSEGIAPDSIVGDFFDSDGDVNTGDAVFWEGDINLAKPNVRVSGNMITDNEPDIEFRSPLFVELDFTRNHMGSADCGEDEDNDHLLANCTNENSEYVEDNFDDIVVTMFELDGVDMTDSVKTTDNQTFLVTLENIGLGDHTAKIQATDVAGNALEDVLEIDFEVSDRDPFERRLNPGWEPGKLAGRAFGQQHKRGIRRGCRSADCVHLQPGRAGWLDGCGA